MDNPSYESSGRESLTGHIEGPEQITASVGRIGPGGYTVGMVFVFENGWRYVLRNLSFTAPDGRPGVTTSGVRDCQLGTLAVATLAYILGNEARWKGGTLADLNTAIESLAQRGKLGPTEDVLELLAVLVEFDTLIGAAPVQAVESRFKVPNRTASRWISLARQRGHLSIFEDLNYRGVGGVTE